MQLSTLIERMRIDRPDEWSMDALARKARQLEHDLADKDNKIEFLEGLLAGDGALITGLKNDQAEQEAEIVKIRRIAEPLLTELMDIVAANGADSRSMPDEYVEAALALSTPPSTTYLDQWEKDRYQVVANKKEWGVCEFAQPTYGELPPNTPLYARKD